MDMLLHIKFIVNLRLCYHRSLFCLYFFFNNFLARESRLAAEKGRKLIWNLCAKPVTFIDKIIQHVLYVLEFRKQRRHGWLC